MNISTIDASYIPQIVSLASSIPYDTGTLGNLDLINNFEQSIKSAPNTLIDVMSDSINSMYFENVRNKRAYKIVVRIWCLIENRQQQAQLDLNYLEEQFIELIEQNMETLVANMPGFEYTENNQIASQNKNYVENYITKEISWTIYKIVNID